MTLFEFFFNQTTKQIKERFREVGLEKYVDVPRNEKDFCKKFGLEPDERISISCWVEDSECKLYLYLTLPNIVYPSTPIKFSPKYYIKSRKGACTISAGGVFENKDCTFFEAVSDLYDDREEYNNIACRVEDEELSGVFDEKTSYWGSEKYWVLGKDKTLSDVYDAVMDYASEMKPYIDKFIDSTKDGSYEKIWNKYLPNKPWKRGNEIFKQYGSIHLKSWMLIDKYRAEDMSFDEFVLLHVATDKRALGDRTIEVLRGHDRNRVKACLEAIEAYKKNFIDDNSFNEWCELYEKANQEFYKRFSAMKEAVSKEFGINPKYLNNTDNCALGFMKFLGHSVPEDAHVLDGSIDSGGWE